MDEELYQYIVSDYSATGEGTTISILITRAYPRADDYEDLKVMPPKLKEGHTAKVRAAREFSEKFDGFYLRGAENLSREEFLRGYGHHLPQYIAKNILSAEGLDRPGNFNYSLQIHLNYS